MEMKKKINVELKNRKPNEIVQLKLDGCLSCDGELDGLTDEYQKLETLSMTNVGLTSLAKLPSLPKLHKLDISDNSLSSGLDVLAEKCPNLTSLNLSANKIKDISTIAPLQNLKKLRSLVLLSCEVTFLDEYRDSVFELLPQLTFLDGEVLDSDGHDDDDDDDEEEEDEDDDDDAAGPPGEGDEDNEEEDDEEDEEEVGLSYLMKEGIQDEEDDDDYVEEDDEEEEEDEDGDEDGAALQGEKRKRDPEDEGDDDEDD